jgi:hypothetical protein
MPFVRSVRLGTVGLLLGIPVTLRGAGCFRSPEYPALGCSDGRNGGFVVLIPLILADCRTSSREVVCLVTT